MSKINASALLTNLVLDALDRQFPGGAFPGGQILNVEEREVLTPLECGPKLLVTLQVDALSETPVTCELQIFAG